MFLAQFKITGMAVGEIFILGALGYLLVKRHFLSDDGLDTLARLVMDVTLPILIFCQLIKDFSFNLYANWWVFPLISLGITAAGFIVGWLLSVLVKGQAQKLQFLSLVTFQNSGYLPLALVAALLPEGQAGTMFIYLFLFLLGFNLIIWSAGVYMLTFQRTKKFELGSLFSPPVAAIIFSLLFIFFGLNKFVPATVMKPLRMFGGTTLPLAMLVIGGNLAQIRLMRVEKKALSLLILAKLVLLPALGLLVINKFNFPPLISLLIIMQLAMPPATTLSVIVRHYKKEDLLVSQGIFFGHVLALVTLPVFLSLYFLMALRP